MSSNTAIANNLPPDISDVRQVEIATTAASAFYVSLVLSQFWHIWYTHTERERERERE
jgi:hypothetical protein